ncbi:Vinorine synthase [Bertholletia excelsa]
MAFKVEIISKEMIKPSSPTPPHLKTLTLSFLDQIVPPVYVPLIFFYSSYKSDRVPRFESLKQSLANTLNRFYPLAGRLRDDAHVDCNDTGAEYAEALVHADLRHVLEDPKDDDLKKLLPVDSYAGGGEVLLAVQANIFQCGAAAVAVCVSHKVADGSSLVAFVNAWAAETRGSGHTAVEPRFDLASIFPPRGDLCGFRPTAGMTKEKVVTRRFVFDKVVLGKLKAAAAAAEGSQVTDPTRVEAVSAFIWKQVCSDVEMMEVARISSRKIYAANHAVNLRPRMSPPLTESSIGNLWRVATAVSPLETPKTYHGLVTQLRTAIKKMDGEYVKSLMSGNAYLEYLRRMSEPVARGEVEFCSFSSWCRFPAYQADFGWGTPAWVSTTTMPFKNVVILMNTRCGEGIEAWVSLLEEDMAVFERDSELISLLNTNEKFLA